jgi:hypothetical protein
MKMFCFIKFHCKALNVCCERLSLWRQAAICHDGTTFIITKMKRRAPMKFVYFTNAFLVIFFVVLRWPEVSLSAGCCKDDHTCTHAAQRSKLFSCVVC